MALRNGIIREYKINITEVDTGRELVFYSSMAVTTITALHPFYTYLCRVSAFTVEYGPYTDNVIFTTLEDGELTISNTGIALCLFHYVLFSIPVPSGFPRDVSVSTVSSQSVNLSWSSLPPDERNGIITGYLATLSRHDMGSQIQLFPSTTSVEFSMLDPFTRYSVTIAASTAIGLGPQSTSLSFTTAEDGVSDKL